MSPKQFAEWCIQKHANTNHYYDKYLPYEFHLRMVVQIFNDFKHLLPENMFVDSHEVHRNMWEEQDRTLDVIEMACWGHDLIEDTRTSYNDVKEQSRVGTYLQTEVADIIYAVTNEKGRNRRERGNDAYYQGIRETPGAQFVKLCDRIANVQYSKLTKSDMFGMYKKENDDFMKKVAALAYPTMKKYLVNLFSK